MKALTAAPHLGRKGGTSNSYRQRKESECRGSRYGWEKGLTIHQSRRSTVLVFSFSSLSTLFVHHTHIGNNLAGEISVGGMVRATHGLDLVEQ